MAKKQDSYYFETFVECVGHACNAAAIMQSTLQNFKPEELRNQLTTIHTEEHAADLKKHELLNNLVKAFITPLEREDIILLSQNIDEMVDQIEDILMRMYCDNVTVIRPDALELADLVVRCCCEVKSMMAEFHDFKRSKKLKSHVIQINTIEEEADEKFMACLRNLHTTCTDPIEVLTWHEIYYYFEKCVDACEHVADCVETVIMKNT